MDFLLTTSRLPTSIEEIRKLGRGGHRVYATDTFGSSPGSHSKHVERAFVTASPRNDADAFIEDIIDILSERNIDLVVPQFEEVFYLARRRDAIEQYAPLFAPDLPVLQRLHDKIRFIELAKELGLPVPPFVVARSQDELAAASREFPKFFARAAYSRGGVTLFTNEGPLAGVVHVEDCNPTEHNPFLVQPFVEGEDLCSFSIVHDDRVLAHANYVHPMTIEHAGGIVFESVSHPETLAITQKVVEAVGYTGQISLDYMRTGDGLQLVECNPRPTPGVTVMPDEMFLRAMTGRVGADTLVAPAGERRKIGYALLRDMVLHIEKLPDDLEELMSDDADVIADTDDPAPMLYQIVAYTHMVGGFRVRNRRIKRTDLVEGYFADITYDGQPL